jgi:dUTP pyrophosphatase
MNKFHAENGSLMPMRATLFSAGYDFVSPVDFIIPAHGVSEVIDGQVSIELDPWCVLLVFVRSSWGFKHGITLVNGTGVIDSDFYPNTIKFKFRNDSDEDFKVKKGDRIAQGILIQYQKAENDSLSCSIRDGGIGSTGD